MKESELTPSGQHKGSDSFFYLILIFLLIGTYSFLLTHEQFSSPDEGLIYGPFQYLQSFKDYWDQFFNGIIVDVQPVRDLFSFFDVWILRHFSIDIRLYQNLFWWFLSLVVLYKNIRLWYPKETFVKWIILAFAVYPLFVQVLVWTSVRKHLLSFSFILLANYFFFLFYQAKISSKRFLFFSFVFYLLSCFSQPINALWPFFVLLFIWRYQKEALKRRVTLVFLISLFLLMLSVLFLNERYYSLYYSQSIGIDKFFANSLGADPRLLSLGRAFWQMIFPYYQSFDYVPEAYANIAGLILFPIFLFIFWKKLKANLIPWIFLLLLPFFVVYIRETPVFFFDVYDLVPSVALLFLVLLSFGKKIELFSLLKYFFVPLILFFACFSYQQTKNWQSNYTIMKHSYELYPSCRQAVSYAYLEWEKENNKNAQAVSDYVIKNNCALKGGGMDKWSVDIFILSTFYGDLPLLNKILLLQKIPSQYFPSLVALAILYHQGGYTESFKRITPAIEKLPSEMMKTSLPLPYRRLKVEYNQLCEQLKTCRSLL